MGTGDDLVASDSMVEEYNYATLRRSEAAAGLREFKTAPRAGEDAPDFDLPTTDGQRIRLSQFRGKKHVVLEFGSIT